MVSQIFTKFNLAVLPDVFVAYKYVFLLMLFALVSHWLPLSWHEAGIKLIRRTGVIGAAIAVVVVIFIIMQVKSSEVQPFIYFQF